METYETEARLKLLASLGVLEALKELRAGFSEPEPPVLEPIAVEEIESPGRYEGMLAVTGRCPRCEVLVTHLTEPGGERHRAHDCGGNASGYQLPRVLVDSLLGTQEPMFVTSGPSFGFGGQN